jgi:hypothetical protein
LPIKTRQSTLASLWKTSEKLLTTEEPAADSFQSEATAKIRRAGKMVAVVRSAANSTEILSDATITSVARVSMERQTSKTIRVDDGPGTDSKVLDQWAHSTGVSSGFHQIGEPTDDAFVESFNGSLFEK